MDLNSLITFIAGIGLISIVQFLLKLFKEEKTHVKKDTSDSAHDAVNASDQQRHDNLNSL